MMAQVYSSDILRHTYVSASSSRNTNRNASPSVSGDKSTAWLKLLSVAVTSSNNAEIKPRSRSACRSLVLYIFTSHYFMGCCVNKWLIKNVLQIAGHSYALPHAKQNCKLTTRPTTIICNKVAEEGGA